MLAGLWRVDARGAVAGSAYVTPHGLQWKDAPAGYGPHNALCHRFVRWSQARVLNRFFARRGPDVDETAEQAMIDATHLKAHRMAASLRKWRLYHAVSAA